MADRDQLNDIRDYFNNTLKEHGATPKGVDWNSEEAREPRFKQLAKVIAPSEEPVSILDYGCGYGALADYLLSKRIPVAQYIGFDIVEDMVLAAQRRFVGIKNLSFTANLNDVPQVDYAIACGVFNMKLSADYNDWTQYVVNSLGEMNTLGTKGFSANFLTKYSDADRMRPDLYYADPSFLFDYCKIHFSKNVALLHDYDLYDFTIVVRKNF
ncbi:MAG: class I SAM-dependent methyltransferase [Anaerolineaceae bacterium]|nr:class I SAM-dependent methyltransferase [Anaerolineaceae bacterium]